MRSLRAAVWNARAALLYSLGGWTVLGAVIHYNSSNSGAGLEIEDDPEANQGKRKEVFTKETGLGLKITTTVTYNEVQPPLTRLLRRTTSFVFPNDGPPSEN
ncbi:small integral membrane protein 26 [Rhynochetos jubatus]